MIVKNRLKEILQEMGIKTMVPTPEVLTQKLGGMTLIRFSKLLNNAGKEIKLHEVQLLTGWLSAVTGKERADIRILAEEEVPA